MNIQNMEKNANTERKQFPSEAKTENAPKGEKRILNVVLLAGYLALVLISQLVVSNYFAMDYLTVGIVLIILLSPLLSLALLRLLSCVSLKNTVHAEKKNGKAQILFFAIPLVVFLVYYCAYYPGAFSPDSFSQYEQAVSNRYNDWHPVLHTLLAFKLPLIVTGGWIGSIVLFQIIAFTLSLGYCFLVLDRYAGRKYTVISMAFVLCNPLTFQIAMYPWKDVTFAIGALLLTTFAAQIVLTRGTWMRKSANMAAFICVFVIATLCRHNGILFTVPLFVSTLFFVAPRRSLCAAAAIIALVAGIKGPVYSLLHVEAPDKRQIETLGLPMTIIGTAVTYSPDLVDEETLTFAYKIASPESWKKAFSFGNYNTLKWLPETNNNVIEEYGREKVLDMAYGCLKASPPLVWRNLVALTEGIYTLTHPHPVMIMAGMSPNNHGIAFSESMQPLRSILAAYNCFINDFFPRIFLYYGTAHLLVVASILAKCSLKRRKDWGKVLLALSMFVYNYGTSLLLTSCGDSPRFFYYSVLILPFILVFLYRKEQEE